MAHRQSTGFTTSIDLVRRQTYPAPLAGQKRPAGDLHPPSKLQHGPGSGSGSRGAARLAASGIRAVVDQDSVKSTATPTGTEPTTAESTEETNPLLSLNNPHYALPKPLVTNFAAQGISTIYAWQASCLLSPGLLTGQRHLVYTAPTGGGKSLVADVLMLKRVVETGRKAILVLPYVALVQEKLKWLRGVVRDVSTGRDGDQGWKQGIRVVGFFGGSRTGSWGDMDIAVCTIEKVHPSSSTLMGSG